MPQIAPAVIFRFLGGAIALVGGLWAVTQLNLPALIQPALAWVQSLGALGAIAYVGLYAAATVLLLPGSLLTLGGGALYGLGWGTLYVLLGASLGATLAFLIGRYLARDWVARRLATQAKPLVQAVDRAIAQSGRQIVLLLRLSPVFPFNLLNYALGLTQVSLGDYVIGFLGMIPGTLLYVYIGSLAGLAAIQAPGVSPAAQRWQWGLRGIGLLATIAVTVVITRVARRALDQTLGPDA